MSEMLQQLLAAITSAPVMERSGSSATVPPPAEQVEALCTFIRQRVAAGSVQPFIVPIPDAFWHQADGVTNQPWAPRGNPAQAYAEACRKVLCGAKGGDGTVVWVSQFTAQGDAEVNADGTKGKRPITGAGLEVRERIPGLAKNIPAEYAHLQG